MAYPSNLPEIARAHFVGSAVERAYLRSDMLELSREMLAAGADFLCLDSAVRAHRPPDQAVGNVSDGKDRKRRGARTREDARSYAVEMLDGVAETSAPSVAGWLDILRDECHGAVADGGGMAPDVVKLAVQALLDAASFPNDNRPETYEPTTASMDDR